jgi:phosphoribosyl-ATP pyrophosphohydrolase/phosphoribosyl-AMP cyclohydrolase
MATLSQLKLDADGLVTVVVQDRLSGEIRMVAHANEAAVAATLESGLAHFYSRSRRALWRKGESSGNQMRVHEIWADCDSDALLYLVDPEGPSCHTGRQTCFFHVLDARGLHEHAAAQGRALLPRLWAELLSRKDAVSERSYTRKLLDEGPPKIAAKVREEGDELARALEGESDQRVVSEAADVVYHALVGLIARGIALRDVEAELARRFGVSGLVEKASRKAASSADE